MKQCWGPTQLKMWCYILILRFVFLSNLLAPQKKGGCWECLYIYINMFLQTCRKEKHKKTRKKQIPFDLHFVFCFLQFDLAAFSALFFVVVLFTIFSIYQFIELAEGFQHKMFLISIYFCVFLIFVMVHNM